MDQPETTSEAAQTVAGMTLEEKSRVVSGADLWHTVAVERAGLPALLMTDGPHGLRKERPADEGGGSYPATCFPPAVALGSSFDPDLAQEVGAAIGREAQAAGIGVVLGPGINLKRSLLCGRNFEYFSEDPLVSGVMGAALVDGKQGEGVGSSLKHFAANNQETDRMRVSADVDERPLRELYLRGFERVVRTARPWTVMCSYNKVNGVRASENRFLLTDVLRGEWGFDGLVVSDWGAVADRVASLRAGLDLEMPGGPGTAPAAVAAAVQDGSLDEATLDASVGRVAALVHRALASARPDQGWSEHEHHALARRVAAACVVLLKNDAVDGAPLLPLREGLRVAVVGELAAAPRYQGAGSSLINPTRLDNALDELRAHGVDTTYVQGYSSAPENSSATTRLVEDAVAAAATADVALAFLGVPAAQESEGFDREHIELPAEQVDLLDRLLAANPRTVVVLSHGGVVRLSGFADRVPAIVEGWLLGQAGGGALADVLTGVVNPSGRLAETVPHRLEDSPAYLDFPGEHGHVRYAEGLFVGYRWYDARDLAVTYPFGHGLSYTTFEHAALHVTVDDGGLLVTVRVDNTGDRDGHEVVQVYVARPGSAVVRAPRELKAFARVAVPAGESRSVTLRVERGDLAYWDTRVHRFVVEGGGYTVEVGASSRDLRQRATVEVPADDTPVPLGADATLEEVLATAVGREALEQAFARSPMVAAAGPDLLAALGQFPLARLHAFGLPGVAPGELAALLDRINAGGAGG